MKLSRRRKVYKITVSGKEVFREVVEKHFNLASTIRGWTLKALIDFRILEKTDVPSLLMPAIRVLLLREDASTEEKIEALKRLKIEFQNLSLLFTTMVSHIDERMEELGTDQSF